MVPIPFLLTLTTVAALGIPTAAATTPGPIKGFAGKCVDVAGSATADGTAVQLYDCNGTGAQAWTVGNPDNTIRALGKCLDVRGAGTADGTRVQLWSCTGSGAQQWTARNGSLVNAGSGRCLDVTGKNSANGTPLQIWSCSGADNQAWTLPGTTAPPPARSGYLGVTFGISGTVLHGGSYDNQGNTIYNLPMYKATQDENAFWDNYVAELLAAGVDYVAPTIRGYLPGKDQYNGGGDTRKLAGLVAAIDRAGAAGKLKISALDDTPASLTDKKNLDKHNAGGYQPPFDIGDANGTGEGGYQYMWDNNWRVLLQTVPDRMRFKLNGRPVVYGWGLGDFAFTNQRNGNIAKMIRYMRDRARAEFGTDLYIIGDQSWPQLDPESRSVVDGIQSWFDMSNGHSLTDANGVKVGVAVPAFHFAVGSTNMNIDADHGRAFARNLDATVGAGASVTLVEGFSDWEENCAMWRVREGSYDQRRYDYPNQMINILRRYSANPFPADLKVEAEGADSYRDTTAGNSGNVFRDGDIDVVRSGDGGGGWDVGSIADGEWLQWQEVPLQGTVTLRARVASAVGTGALRFVVDGTAGPTVTVPNTGGAYQTITAGTFTLPAGSRHTVRAEFVRGSFSLNFWSL
jgi:hypothetical protein